MATHSNVNNEAGPYRTAAGIANENSRRIIYDQTTSASCNTSVSQHPHAQQTLSFSDQPSPHIHNVTMPNSHVKLEDVLNDIYAKLHNLESLPSIDRRLGAIEHRFSSLETELVKVKQDIGCLEGKVIGTEQMSVDLSQRLNFVEHERDEIRRENNDLRERLIDVQGRSMRENLLFGGIGEDENEKNDPDNIHTERVLQTFIKDKLEISDKIEFHVVHRLRPRRDGKPRTIIAKFEKRKDKDRVLKAAPIKLRETPFSIYEQYPNEIMERRNILWPIFKREQRRGSHVRLKEDKLYVNGQRIYPEDVVQSQQVYVPNNEFQGASQKQIIRTNQQIQEGHSFLKQHYGPPTRPNPVTAINAT